MTNKLFVGGIDYNVTDSQLEAHFATIGKVLSAKIIVDKYTGQGKGFGFVEMETQEAADAAIAAMDGKDFEGRTIVVNVARPKEDRPSNGGNNFRGGFQRR